MAIVKAVQKPCWIAQGLPYGDEEHYATRAEAMRAALAHPDGARLFRCPVLCYWAICDGCGYREGEAEGPGHHLPAFEPYHVLMDLHDLQRPPRGGLLCEECREELDPAALPSRFQMDPADALALVDQVTADLPSVLRPWVALEVAG